MESYKIWKAFYPRFTKHETEEMYEYTKGYSSWEKPDNINALVIECIQFCDETGLVSFNESLEIKFDLMWELNDIL